MNRIDRCNKENKALQEKIEVLEAKTNYKTPITLSELKAHYEFNKMNSEDFINLIKLWHETNEIG